MQTMFKTYKLNYVTDTVHPIFTWVETKVKKKLLNAFHLQTEVEIIDIPSNWFTHTIYCNWQLFFLNHVNNSLPVLYVFR